MFPVLLVFFLAMVPLFQITAIKLHEPILILLMGQMTMYNVNMLTNPQLTDCCLLSFSSSFWLSGQFYCFDTLNSLIKLTSNCSWLFWALINHITLPAHHQMAQATKNPDISLMRRTPHQNRVKGKWILKRRSDKTWSEVNHLIHVIRSYLTAG